MTNKTKKIKKKRIIEKIPHEDGEPEEMEHPKYEEEPILEETTHYEEENVKEL